MTTVDTLHCCLPKPPIHMTAGNGAVTTVSVRQVAGTNSAGRQQSGDNHVGAAAAVQVISRLLSVQQLATNVTAGNRTMTLTSVLQLPCK